MTLNVPDVHHVVDKRREDKSDELESGENPEAFFVPQNRLRRCLGGPIHFCDLVRSPLRGHETDALQATDCHLLVHFRRRLGF